jgi:hypothetical protein
MVKSHAWGQLTYIRLAATGRVSRTVASNKRWAVRICYGMVTCCAEQADKRLRSVRLRKGQLCVSHTGKSHEQDLPGWKRKFKGDLFRLDHDHIADFTVRSAVYGPSERY